MIFTLDDRPSDLPFVERIWCAQSERTGVLLSIAMSHWEMVVSRYQDKTYLTVRGPETKATALPVTMVGTAFFGIRFKVGTVMPSLPASTLVDADVNLPDASSKSFWLNGSAWQFPSYENADTFVERLALGAFAIAFVIGAVYLSRVALALDRLATGTDFDLKVAHDLLSRWIVGYQIVLLILLFAVWDMVFKPGL